MATNVGSLRFKLGMMLCALLICVGCDDSGDGSSDGALSGAGTSGSGNAQRLEADLEATTSNSVLMTFHCTLDYTVDLHASAADTEAWVRDYLAGCAESVAGTGPYQAFHDEPSLFNDKLAIELNEGIVGLPGVYGTPSFEAECRDFEFVFDPSS